MDTLLGRQRYSALPNDSEASETAAKDAKASLTVNWAHCVCFWLCGLFVGFFTVIVYNNVSGSDLPALETTLPGVLPRVPLKDWVTHHVHRDHQFEAPPAENATREPLWDSLLPSGFGYIKHPDISPNVSVIGSFHALHCLYIIRRAYYAPNQEKAAFDLEIERGVHVGHCFDYLKQTITCTIDPTIEPATKRLFQDPTWGFDKQCRNFEEIKAWAERYRAWDAPGTFIPFKEHERNDTHTMKHT